MWFFKNFKISPNFSNQTSKLDSTVNQMSFFLLFEVYITLFRPIFAAIKPFLNSISKWLFQLPCVCPSIHSSVHPFICPKTRLLHFLPLYHKMSLKKDAWYVLGVKKMHPGSPSHPSWTATAEAKPRCVYSILKPHGQSSRSPVRLLGPWGI